MLDQANVNCFILCNLNEKNVAIKKLNFMLELSSALIRFFLIKRLVTPTLRLKLRLNIENFLERKDLPKNQDRQDMPLSGK